MTRRTRTLRASCDGCVAWVTPHKIVDTPNGGKDADYKCRVCGAEFTRSWPPALFR